MAFEPDRYEREVIRPMRGRNAPLTDDDLLRRYAIGPELDDAVVLRAHLRRLRTFWNQTASGPDSKAQVCKRLLAADEELQRRPDVDLTDPAWWRRVAEQRAARAKETVAQVAADLKQAFGATRQVTRAQVAGVAKQYPELEPADIEAALRRAQLRVVEVVDLPESSGLERVAYRELGQRLREVGVPTLVQLLHPDLARPFALVQRFAVNGEPERRLDTATLETRIKEADRAADSSTLRARRAAMRILQTGVRAGADLRAVALFQVVEQLLESRGDGLVAPLLIRQAARLGLTQEDAELVVASLPSSAGGSSVAATLRDLLAAGRLRAARAALGTLPATDPERPQIVAEIDRLETRLAELLAAAEQALRQHREEEAERLVLQARRIAEDDDEVRTRYARLPMAPPRELRAVVTGAAVHLDWQPPATTLPEVVYRVARRVGADPAGVGEGEPVAGTAGTAATDTRPPPARDLRYAVFAGGADGAVWSRPAIARVRLVPEPADVTVRGGTNRITVTWQAAAELVAVRARRTEGRPPRDPDDGVAVPAGAGTLVDRQVRAGVEYFYGLVAVYHDERRREVRSEMTVVSGSLMAEARPLDRLSVETVRRHGGSVQMRLTWPADAGTVRVRYGAGPPAWPYGAVVGHTDMARYGREVPGVAERHGADLVLDADLPAGPHLYVPFSVGSTGIVVGRAVHVGQAEPVRTLHVRRTGARVAVTWVWPADAGVAEVVWEQPDAAAETRRVSRAAYVDGGGCVLTVGARGGTVTVRAITVGPAGETLSDPVREAVPGRAVELRWTLRRPSGWRERYSGRRELEITTDQDCDGLDLAVVVAPGPVMPLAATPETVVERFTGLAPRRGVPVPLSFTVPRTAKPYWIRCFATRPAGLTVIDPPVAELKVS